MTRDFYSAGIESRFRVDPVEKIMERRGILKSFKVGLEVIPTNRQARLLLLGRQSLVISIYARI